MLGYASRAVETAVPARGIVPLVLAARFMDRLGKGIRGRRDALIADVTPEGLRGAAYGLRQALDTVGAFTGPLAAIGLMLIFEAMCAQCLVRSDPAIIAVAVVCVAVREPESARAEACVQSPGLRCANSMAASGSW